MEPLYLLMALFITGVKVLLIPAYRSTDFEVHRNWLAITHSLPVSRWYSDWPGASEWTLDYPPLFAWFEWLLSQPARLVDAAMLDVNNLNYASEATVVYQRLTVMVADVVLMAAAYRGAQQQAGGSGSGSKRGQAALFTYFAVVCSAGLLLVDHVHFQYNGFLLGVLLLAVDAAQRRHDWLCGLLFACLLNLKHLFAYAAPVFFFHILRHHCAGRHAVARFCAMCATVAAVCAASLGPFAAAGQLRQIAARLFPFGRGLVHSYWAANGWALYSAADKVLAAAAPRLGLPLRSAAAAVGNLSTGRVGVSSYAVLPNISPPMTLAAVLAAMTPCLQLVWRAPHPQRFAHDVAYAMLCGFMFGYHVHEKAILMALVPLALCAAGDRAMASNFVLLSAAGTYGLLPLLFRPQEYPIKLLVTALYLAVCYSWLQQIHSQAKPRRVAAANGSSSSSSSQQAAGAGALTPSSSRQALATSRSGGSDSGGGLLSTARAAYVLGLLAVELYCSALHPLLLGQRLPFLPLLLTSVYCALGVTWVWLDMAATYVMQLQA